MPPVRMITGTSRSGRAAYIDRLLLERLTESLLVVPTTTYARRRTSGLLKQLGRAAILDPPVITFAELAKRILRGSGFDTTPIGPLEQRIVLQRAVARVRATGALESLDAAADSEGFLDHLLAIIGQLKQAAIEPAEFRRRVRKRNHAMDTVVSEVYSAYQDELKQSGSVDLQGMYWLARIACEGPALPVGIGHARRLLFDDFDDFTPSEFRVIRALSNHVEEMAFGLNLSDDPERRSLYTLPLSTRDVVHGSFDDVRAIACDESEITKQSEFVAASLLVRKDTPTPAGLSQDVSFVECHTVEHEIETIARRIKYLARTEDVPLPRIAVVWRNTASVAAPMREIFAEFGIPLAGLESRTLTESAIAGFVLRFLNAAQTWTPEAVLDVLTSPWFIGPSAAHADVFPILVRAARVRPTRNGWRGSLERLTRYLDDPLQIELQRLAQHVPGSREASVALLDTFAQFTAQCDEILRAKTVGHHVGALLGLLNRWPIVEAIAALPGDDDRALEEAALSTLTHTLGLLHSFHATDSARVDVGRFAQMLRRAFVVSALSTPSPEGAVACLGMEPARYLHFDYVFLAGMTDVHVPAGRKLSAIYTEDERAELGAAGIALEPGEIHNQREVLLFQRMFTTALKHLAVSWHRLAPGGTSVQRSLYISEVADRLGGLAEYKSTSPEDAMVPAPDLAACTRDAQNLAVPNKAGSVDFAEIAGTAGIETRRYGFQPCDRHDGLLAEKDSAAWLTEHYGPAHVYSASQLEAYAECPFRFFQERVLNLLEIETPEQAFDHLARGKVLHDALEAFHGRYLGKAILDIPADEALASMSECAGTAFDKVAVRFRNLTQGLLTAERTRTIATLQRHVRLQQTPKKKAPESWPTTETEVAFGRAGGDSAFPPFALTLGSEEIQLAGRIDRVDRNNGEFRLVDYKSSPVQPKKINEGKTFQLALYALAAESMLFPGERCADAFYLPVGHDKNPAIALSRSGKIPYEERIDAARTAVAAAVAGIRAGKFHPTQDDKPCAGCMSQKVCRFERERLRRKHTA